MQLEFARQREADKAEMQKEVLAAKAEAAVERAKLEGDARCAQLALDAQMDHRSTERRKPASCRFGACTN